MEGDCFILKTVFIFLTVFSCCCKKMPLNGLAQGENRERLIPGGEWF
jgi:hypothetical protein